MKRTLPIALALMLTACADSALAPEVPSAEAVAPSAPAPVTASLTAVVFNEDAVSSEVWIEADAAQAWIEVMHHGGTLAEFGVEGSHRGGVVVSRLPGQHNRVVVTMTIAGYEAARETIDIPPRIEG